MRYQVEAYTLTLTGKDRSQQPTIWHVATKVIIIWYLWFPWTSRSLCGFVSGCPVEHRLSVIACDSGTPNLQCGSTNVVIYVKSINNHAPQFVNMTTKMAVLRTTPVNTKVCHSTSQFVRWMKCTIAQYNVAYISLQKSLEFERKLLI